MSELDFLEQGRRAARHAYYADSAHPMQWLWAITDWKTRMFWCRECLLVHTF
jgi:hypothetical protein